MIRRKLKGLKVFNIKTTRIKRDGPYLLALSLPFVVAVFLFKYLPLFGWKYAFFDYKPGLPLSMTPFVGFEKFMDMFTYRREVLNVLRNTLVLSFLNIICNPLPVILAILLTEVKNSKFRRIVQTTTTLPNFMSWIIIFSFSFFLFSAEGILNQMLSFLKIIDKPLNILGNEKIAWFFQTGLNVWKTIGWNAVIYIAAITGIDDELYQAAMVDGAGRFQRIIHITVPGVSETFIVLLLINIGFMLNAGSGMQQYLVFMNPLVEHRLEVLDLYVYRVGLIMNDYGFATAVGILKTLVSLLLIFTVNNVSKRIRGQSIV